MAQRRIGGGALGLAAVLLAALLTAQGRTQSLRGGLARSGGGNDPSDVARQNQITQQILAQYLQRRLFPQLNAPRFPTNKFFPRTAKSTTTTTSTTERPPPELEPEPEAELEPDYEPEPDEDPPEDILHVPDKPDSLQEGESEEVSNFLSSQGGECTNCVDESAGAAVVNRWTMPLLKLGEKRYYLGIFFKANWYRAAQYCRYHGMHLASINSQEENDRLEKHIRDFGLGHEHFWTSGTDQAEEGTFFWMATGRPITFTNWNTGEPNNFRYENGEEEHCLELWNRDGKGLKWNDSPCSFETFFVCEVQ
ncbi:mannose-binding protein C [Schistocerca nitens]|uniref:mannose-binding protein C n=1 Tax=Schistocerca nitens TaxID=7011 RepID=UPI002118DFFE|nr:mannose-binding protein C [Schistocerca nitens]